MPAPSRPDPERLAAIIVEMRRALRRSLRPADQDEAGTERAEPAPHSPPSPLEAEVVRFVAAHPGAGTSAIARALRLRPNTVSGLCSTLVRSGVLRREQDPRDRRAARFQLTDEAAARRHRRMTSQGDRLESVLDELADEDARAIAAALPALERLIDALEAEQTR
ncbi:MAG TPA: MarR family transcriptional regulator [Brachybacterium sp.]|nr:MarR family transcriptional regulator [Brachybacterium sp.]